MHDPITSALIAQLEEINPGLPFDQFKMVICLLLAYPLAVVHSYLGRNQFQHIYSLIFGAYFAWFMFGYQILHSFGTSLVAYFILKFMDRSYSHKIVFVWMMGYLFAAHAYRMYTDYMGWSMDFTGPQMLLTIKMTAMAFNYHDGAGKDTTALDEFQRKHRLAQLPGLLPFFGWVYCYLGFLAGPACELNDYVGLTTGALWAEGKRKAGEIPGGRFLAALKVFAGGVVCVAVGQYMQQYTSHSYINSAEFQEELWFPYRLLSVLFFSIAFRMPYYFAWKMSEGSCILAGLGYSGEVDGQPEWNRCCNANVLQVEFAQNIKAVTDGWNLATDHWLKHYIYARVKTTSFKAYDVYLTLLVSAIWHGLYAGYYLSFITAALLIQTARLARRAIRPKFMEADGKTPKASKPFYDALTFVLHQIVFNYTMIPFVLLDHWRGLKFWGSLYFIGHIATISGYILFAAMGGNKKRSSSTTREPKPAKLKQVDTPHPKKGVRQDNSSPYQLRSRTKK